MASCKARGTFTSYLPPRTFVGTTNSNLLIRLQIFRSPQIVNRHVFNFWGTCSRFGGFRMTVVLWLRFKLRFKLRFIFVCERARICALRVCGSPLFLLHDTRELLAAEFLSPKQHKGIVFCVKIRSGVSPASPSAVSVPSRLHRRPVSA